MMSNVGKGGVFVRWKEKGIGVAERDSECGGPEGKETTSNIDHIYGSILTLPSQISTLSPPPLVPLSPSPFLSQKPPSSLCFVCKFKVKLISALLLLLSVFFFSLLCF